MPPEPPRPVAARFYLAAVRLEVDFDHRLRPGPIDANNWSADVLLQAYAGPIGGVGATVGSTAAATLVPTLPTFDPNACHFAPPPFDVVSRLHKTPAAAFVNFPVNVLP